MVAIDAELTSTFNVCQLVAATNRPRQAKVCLNGQVRNNDASLISYTS